MAGFSNYLRNRVHDFLLRAQPFTPPSTLYYDLCSTIPTAGIAGTPLTGTGYSRVGLASSLASYSGTQGDGTTAPSTGTSGTVSNNVVVDFGVAGSAWGTAVAWETYDAPTGGNRIDFGTLVNGVGVVTPRLINTGDPVSFPVASLRRQLL